MSKLNFKAQFNLFMVAMFALQSTQVWGQFSTLGPKTEAEQTADASYYHEGYHQAALDDICAGSGDAVMKNRGNTKAATDKELAFVCSGQEDQTWMVMVEAASGAYAALMPFLSMGGGGKFQPKTDGGKKAAKATKATDTSSTTSTEAAPAAEVSQDGSVQDASGGKNTKKENKEKQDLCIWIPIAGEAAATAWQAIETSKIEANLPNVDSTPTGTEQYEYISAVKRTHEASAKSAGTKASMYGATAACYIAYGFSNIQLDAGYWLKLGASTVLGAFYFEKMRRHNAYARIAGNIMASLPSLGECSPQSNPQCYCSQESTKYDPNYCLPIEAVGRVSATMNGVACTDENLQVDPNCDCVAQGTCFGTAMVSGLSGLDLGSAYSGATKSAIDALSSGSYDSADTFSQAEGALAAARNMFDDGSQMDPSLAQAISENMNAGEAEALFKAGIPRSLAALASTFPKDSTAKNFANQNTKGFSRQEFQKTLAGDTPRFQSGSGTRRKVTSADVAPANSAKAGGNSGQILKFADKALEKAQINRDSGANLFEIISKRYRLSAEDYLK